MLNRTICLTMVLLSNTLLFTVPSVSIKTPLANNIKEEAEVKIIPIENIINEQYKKDKAISDKIKADELQKQKELEEQKNKPQWQEFILTYYTSLISENSSAGAITCQGKKLSRGGVANNVIPQNTKLYLEGYGEVIVNDRGSNKHFSVDTRLDVFIEKEQGESDSHYKTRVNNMGVRKVHGYIIK